MFSFELDILKYLEGIRTGFLNAFIQGITFLGEETLMIILVVSLWFAVDKKMGQKLLFITASSLTVNGIIKNIVQRPRPFTKGISCVREDTATGFSFPSGHTQGFATWSSLFAIKMRKIWISILVGILIVAVGFSRLYLGAHYPTDVITSIVLGIGLAVLGNTLFDRIKDTKKLYLGTVLLFTPFFIYFLFDPNLLFEDSYKTFGMICGLLLVSILDEKTEELSYNVVWWKKLLRIIIGVAVTYALKEGIKALNVFDIMQISLIFDAIRYFVVVFALGYLCPLLFKKIKL